MIKCPNRSLFFRMPYTFPQTLLLLQDYKLTTAPIFFSVCMLWTEHFSLSFSELKMFRAITLPHWWQMISMQSRFPLFSIHCGSCKNHNALRQLWTWGGFLIFSSLGIFQHASGWLRDIVLELKATGIYLLLGFHLPHAPFSKVKREEHVHILTFIVLDHFSWLLSGLHLT